VSILDWRHLAPEPQRHECDCRFCDLAGDDEPLEFPTLVIADGDGVDYVTDRYLMVRGDLAPVPDGYEGQVITQRPDASGLLASLAGISNRHPVGFHFRWSILKALDLTGWDLRLINGKTDPATGQRVAVVDQDGLPIGVAISVSESRRIDNEWSKDFSCEYGVEE
jgi:hypothetical protein